MKGGRGGGGGVGNKRKKAGARTFGLQGGGFV